MFRSSNECWFETFVNYLCQFPSIVVQTVSSAVTDLFFAQNQTVSLELFFGYQWLRGGLYLFRIYLGR
jgi:hypothetical protein